MKTEDQGYERLHSCLATGKSPWQRSWAAA